MRTLRQVLAANGVLLVTAIAPAAAAEKVTLNVYRGVAPDLAFVKAIPVGREPHNLGVSPDGRWVATSDRRSGEVSIIDTERLEEAARPKLGRQTRDAAFTPDSRTLFVGHETETFISVVEVGTLWFTVTNRPYKAGDPRLGVVNLGTGKVTLIDTGANAHDVTLSPDGTVAWVTNSGFTHLPDARVDYVDVATRRPLGSLTVGKYPFHSPKRGRDGNAVPTGAPEMWFSDHGLKSIVAVSLADRRGVATVAGGTLFVANHTSNTVTIVDGARRAVLGTLNVPPRPHGLAVVPTR